VTDAGEDTEVIGVVDPFGGPGGRGSGDGRWTFRLTLAAWRLGAGPLTASELTLTEAALTQGELRQRMGGQNGGDVVRARVRGPIDAGPPPSVLLVSSVEIVADPDAEVAAARAALLQPVVVDHPRGRLVYQRSWAAFHLETTWAGRPTTVALVVDEVAVATDLLDRIGPWLDRSDEVDADCRRWAADRLLDIHDQSWRDEGSAPVTPTEMASRLESVEVTVTDDGGFEVDYGDDGMFWGHTVVVSGSVEEGPDDADIVG